MFTRPAYLRRSLAHFRRTNFAVVLGVVAGAAALTGALIVGDSMRGSLRAAALDRLGRVDQAMIGARFFRQALADEITVPRNGPANDVETASAILLRGTAGHADTRARAGGVNLLGVDSRFWRLDHGGTGVQWSDVPDRAVVLNAALAEQLGAERGDDVLLRVPRPADVSPETLLGRRDDTTVTLRLPVHAVVPAEGLGAFDVAPGQRRPRNAYVPLRTLQQALNRRDRVNAVLLAALNDAGRNETLDRRIRRHVTLGDLGLGIRHDAAHGYVALESDAMLLPPPVEAAAETAAAAVGGRAVGVLTYLANQVTVTPPAATSAPAAAAPRSIPYSTVSAIGPLPLPRPIAPIDAGGGPGPDDIWLNAWAADELQASIGDRIELAYYVTDAFGHLDTRRRSFRLAAIVPLLDAAADPGFTPDYPGVTDTASIADWDPPFPVDLKLIRDQDEAYWSAHRATPKAFIQLADGQAIWAEDGDRFGRLTSLRVYPADASEDGAQPPPAVTHVAALAAAFERELLARLDPAALGLAVEPLRARAEAAGRGSTDFGTLFIGFSFFVIASAAMLVALLFRLGVERRASEFGLLLAQGFSPRGVLRLLVTEGLVLAVIGAAIGAAAALGYAWLMLAGLRSWWSAAVNAPFLRLHVSTASLAIGLVASVVIAVASIAVAVRRLTRFSPRALLAGIVQSGAGVSTVDHETDTPAPAPIVRFDRAVAPVSRRVLDDRLRGGRDARLTQERGTITAILFTSRAVPLMMVALCVTMITLFIVLAVFFDWAPHSSAFFGSGAAALGGWLGGMHAWLRQRPRDLIHKPGLTAAVRLGVRNARRHSGRSLLTIALIASASFIIISLEAFRLDAPAAGDRRSGTGGFALVAESAAPLPFDLNTPTGRESLNIRDPAAPVFRDMTAVPLRLRAGGDASCLNLYKPDVPRILGAADALIDRGGFTFAGSLAETADERANPWRLLNRPLPDGAIPVIGDEAAVKWQLHLGLGQDLTITDERGRDVRLRFVALLSGSVLQSELVVAESDFTRLFPTISGHGFFLIDAPAETAGELSTTLERELEPFGFDTESASQRLAAYLAVQNTYLSTFQTLGGFGLVLGAVGLAAVLLRNVWERRRELALLRALGFSNPSIGAIVLSENAALVAGGLVSGVLPALLSIAPHLATRAAAIPWASLALTLASVFLVGMAAGAVALAAALHAPLLPALRSE